MSKTIAIVGVTGNQGSSVAKTFLQIPGWTVRGLTRDPSKQAAQDLAAKGVEIVEADLDDVQTLIPAFEGATVIFSNTDFWAPFLGAMMSKVDTKSKSSLEYAHDVEISQGVNTAEAASSPVVLKTLERFIYSSLSDPLKWGHGKYPDIWHYKSKAETVRIIQSKFPEVAKRMSLIQIGHYVTNWKAAPSMGPQKQPDGGFVWSRPLPADEEIMFVVANRDTGPYIKALVDMSAGTQVLATSEIMTWATWTKLWGNIMGVEATYKQLNMEDFLDDAPPDLKKELQDSFAFMSEFGFTGGDPAVLTVNQLGEKVSLTSMEDYIRNEDWSSVL